MKGPRCYQRSRSPPRCLRSQGPLEAAKCAALYHNFAAAVSYYLLRTPASSSLGNGDNVGQERLAELPPCAATAVPAAAAAAAAAAVPAAAVPAAAVAAAAAVVPAAAAAAAADHVAAAGAAAIIAAAAAAALTFAVAAASLILCRKATERQRGLEPPGSRELQQGSMLLH